MPKKKRRNPVGSFSDVTLNDFANSSVPKNRIKKSLAKVNVVLTMEVEKTWDDKDEVEFEGQFVYQENEDGTVSYVIQKGMQNAGKKALPNQHEGNRREQDGGRDYPIDIWHILSDYIRPEDVGTFAAICRTSFEVVCSARFWFGLYRRYYRNVPNMPETLQPESLIRRYGLRKNVIRALYRMYQPFVDRVKPVTTFEEHPESLKNHECHLMWYIMKSAHYIYFFKMKRKVWTSLARPSDRPQLPNLLEMLDDVSANTDEYCRVLEVSCLHFNPVPPVLGLTLKTVTLTLSSAPKFRYHRLQLTFGSAISSRSNSSGGADSTTVILDPVINIKVLDWWHPQYPSGQFDMGELLRNQD